MSFVLSHENLNRNSNCRETWQERVLMNGATSGDGVALVTFGQGHVYWWSCMNGLSPVFGYSLCE